MGNMEMSFDETTRQKKPLDLTMRDERILSTIMQEVKRAQNLFPSWPKDPLHALSIVQEEVGETFKAALEVIYEPDKKGASMNNVLDEAVQMAAMTIRFISGWSEYEFKKSKWSQNK
jgi:NTP pyrophosphatase (non-canonical NTP hydrolase)